MAKPAPLPNAPGPGAGPGPVRRGRAMLFAALLLSVAGSALAGCSSPPSGTAAGPAPPGDLAGQVRVVALSRPIECVPYARRHSGIDLRGDAWTWWDAAEGRYARGSTPRAGALLVLARQGKTRGHLALVTRVAGLRIVIANHANWLNEGRVFENTPIMDVSERGDWSAVRVWYPPGHTWGRRVYAVRGFIYPERRHAATP